MTDTYGLPEYKALLERELKRLSDPNEVPFGCNPASALAINIRLSKRESINYALEMLPDFFDIARHAKRLVEQQREEIADLKVDADRYHKLRRWMSSGVQEGWDEVTMLAAVSTYMDWSTFDTQLDSLPVCNVGLCEVFAK